jgi:capsular polysaccharide biosynthesis protein
MQRRYKLLFFLKYKLKLKLFKKIESKFAKKIISEVEIDHSPRFNVRFKFLVFDIYKTNSSIFDKSRILLHVLSVRALTRTLIFTTQAIPNSNEIYEISRLKLGMELLKNLKPLLGNLVYHLSFDYLNFEEFSGMKLLTPIHIGNKYLADSLKHQQAYVIEKTYGKKIFLEFDINDKIRKTALDKFIAWDSSIFIQFLKSNKLEETANEYLRDNYPLLFIEKSRYVEMEYVNHEHSNFSFDDIYQKGGLDSFDTILNGEIWHQRFICFENRIINFDATSFPTQKFVAGNWQFGNGDKKNSGVQVVLRPSEISISLSEAIFLMGRCDENWYHFLLDTAPRLLFFENVPANVPILIRSDLPSTTKEFLTKLTPRNVIEVEPDKTVIVSRLYVCPGRSTIFDSTPPKGLNWVEFSPLVLSLFRRKVLDSLDVSSGNHSDARITFERKSATRNTKNWSSAQRVLRDFSFQTLQFNLNFYRKQVKVFHDAEFVVASGGAVLANIIFMKPESKVLVLRSWRFRKLNIWGALSKSANLKYFEVRGFPTYWGFKFLRRMHSDYFISPRKLRRILSREI